MEKTVEDGLEKCVFFSTQDILVQENEKWICKPETEHHFFWWDLQYVDKIMEKGFIWWRLTWVLKDDTRCT